MKNITYLIAFFTVLLFSCDPQIDDIGDLGDEPTVGDISIDATDPYNPIFRAETDRGFTFHWDLGNGQEATGQTATAYYPFSGDYDIKCTIYGVGASNIVAQKTFNVANTDPAVANLPVWKELTGAGAGKTWVFNTDRGTGFPDYSYQTTNDLATYPEGWTPDWSWGQCLRFTPDLYGEMVFDLNGGINYTYYQTEGGEAQQGTFILNTEDMTLTVPGPYILDHDVDCTNPAITSAGVYQIKRLTDDEMVLWQDQVDEWSTGWSWSFKRKE